MALVDLKRTAADKKAQKEEWDGPIVGDDYPYGLNLSLDDATLKKLGISDLKGFGLDVEVTITARACVRSTSENQERGKTHRSMSLQIEAMELTLPEPASPSKVLYDKD